MVKLEVVYDIGRPRLLSTLPPHRNQLIENGREDGGIGFIFDFENGFTFRWCCHERAIRIGLLL